MIGFMGIPEMLPSTNQKHGLIFSAIRCNKVHTEKFCARKPDMTATDWGTLASDLCSLC
jgi:hypothetical protein